MEHTITISRIDLYTLIWSLSDRKDHLERMLRKANRSFPIKHNKVGYLFSRLCELNSILERLQAEWIGGEADEK